MSQLVIWLKHSKSPTLIKLVAWAKKVKRTNFPVIPLLHALLYKLHLTIAHLLAEMARVFYYTPIFKSQVKGGASLYLYSGMPQLLGKLDVQLGNDVRMSGISTFCGRGASVDTPKLTIGNNVDIGWQNAFSVGTEIVIEDNVRLAGRVFLAGYPGHPINANARAQGLPDLDHQAKAILLQKDVWIGTGVTIVAGVTIGSASIVAAGSVVTKSMPANALIAGNPARVVKDLTEQARSNIDFPSGCETGESL